MIDKTTTQWLDRLHAQQAAYFSKTILFKKWKVCPFVFVNKRLEKISDNAVNKTLKKACRRFGCTEITFHGLRHTHASILLYKRIDIGYISRRLGHSSIMTTYRIYTHIIDELAQRDAFATLNVIDDIFQVEKEHAVVELPKKSTEILPKKYEKV